jgi:hypothetical protein
MATYKTKPLVIREFFEPIVYATIIQFMDDLLPAMWLASDLSQPDSPDKFGRQYGHNIRFFSDIHHQLKDYASELFGEKVKPSYSFLSMYKKKGQCPLHIDRPQCRYTIDYLIRQDQDKPWPICVGPQMDNKHVDQIEQKYPETNKEQQAIIDSVDWTTVNLNPNDAVCYSGTNSWHYRPTKSTGNVDLIFFHFVPEDFNGPLD